MSVAEILEQAKALSPQERKELAKSLIDMMDAPEPGEAAAPAEHWGKSLNQLLDEIGPIELKYPEIEDPVEWVKHLRAESRRQRLGNWGEEE
ncbi:MAG: hypothetical protein CL610_20030 [Anaerolineaceae bacterium]|nr:hypothetical protein [Anaerolineaceae bacterium]